MGDEVDHLEWRVDPLGWDKDDREYYVLDDNRLYRRTDEPVPPPSPKPKSKAKAKAKSKAKSKNTRGRATRSSKRFKAEETPEEEEPDDEEEQDVETNRQEDTTMVDAADVDDQPGYGFTSKTWECVAVTLEEYQDFLSTIFRTRDPNEKELRRRIEDEVMPIIEKRAEAIRQKQLKKMREWENEQKMATAKRSGRLADKAGREKKEREEREAEENHRKELEMARAEQERQRRIEEV